MTQDPKARLRRPAWTPPRPVESVQPDPEDEPEDEPKHAKPIKTTKGTTP